jgi:hypothetical protein
LYPTLLLLMTLIFLGLFIRSSFRLLNWTSVNFHTNESLFNLTQFTLSRLHLIHTYNTFRGSRNDCRMWNKSHKYKSHKYSTTEALKIHPHI